MTNNNHRKPPETIQKMGVLLEDVAHQVSVVADGVVANSEKIEQLETAMSQGFARVDKRVDSLEATMTQGFAKIEAELRALRTMLGTPERPNIITREEFVLLEKRLTALEQAVLNQ